VIEEIQEDKLCEKAMRNKGHVMLHLGAASLQITNGRQTLQAARCLACSAV
jgi:hypothetical protein